MAQHNFALTVPFFFSPPPPPQFLPFTFSFTFTSASLGQVIKSVPSLVLNSCIFPSIFEWAPYFFVVAFYGGTVPFEFCIHVLNCYCLEMHWWNRAVIDCKAILSFKMLYTTSFSSQSFLILQSVQFSFKEINTFIRQRCIKLIIYNFTKDDRQKCCSFKLFYSSKDPGKICF